MRIDGNRGDALFHLGLARKSLGREDHARSAFMQAIDLDPRDVYAKSALRNLDTEDKGRRNVANRGTTSGRSGSQTGGRRIALHLSTRGQYPILRPIFEALGDHHWPLMTCDGRELQEFGASVIVMAGSHAAALKQLVPDASVVNVGFGLASKNFLGRVGKIGDFLCAPGAAAAADIRERRGLPENRVWATGYPPMDALFAEISRSGADHANKKRPTIVYAPTDRHFLSSVQMLGSEVLELLTRGRTDIELVLRPHPRHCEHPPPWLAVWRELAAKHNHVTLVDDPAAAAASWLANADVLVSDASSIMLEFLALDRPMVLLSNPDRFNDPTHFDAAGLEWVWRDMGEEIYDVELLSEAVNRALSGADERADIRRGYRDYLYGDMTDGNAAKRIAAQIATIRNVKG